MVRSIRILTAAVVLFLGLAASCAHEPTPIAQKSSPVPISDFSQIAGRWEGVMLRSPNTRNTDWVKVRIGEDGAYVFESYRLIGVFRGKGTLQLEQDKAVSSTEHGRLSFTLYEQNGTRMLHGNGRSKEGVEYSADLQPTR